LGVTVLTPEVGTSPIPSIEMVVASDVRQERTTWSPAEITEGVAVICAVGAGAEEVGGAVIGAGGASFFLQPATATNATSKTAGTKIREREFNGLLLPKFEIGVQTVWDFLNAQFSRLYPSP
jgi:hypothetical protein